MPAIDTTKTYNVALVERCDELRKEVDAMGIPSPERPVISDSPEQAQRFVAINHELLAIHRALGELNGLQTGHQHQISMNRHVEEALGSIREQKAKWETLKSSLPLQHR